MTTIHDNHLTVPSAGCSHPVCLDCPEHTVTTRTRLQPFTDGASTVRFTYTNHPAPLVGQTVRATDADGTVFVGHVTSQFGGLWHAHLRLATPPQDIERWMPVDESERSALAHLRGWAHLGPVCPVCRIERGR